MMMDLLGYFFAVVIGFTLGLLGGGGSILTVPVMKYVMGIDTVTATAYSLFVVGITSLVGAANYMPRKQVSYQTAFIFGIPSFITVYLTRRYVIPSIPDTLFSFETFLITKDIALMVLFAIIMLAASFSMIRSGKNIQSQNTNPQFNYPLIILEGVVVGGLTGLVGAGGGFLIVPALVVLARLPMKLAIGTSLLIIAAKSLIGFLGDLDNLPIDWQLLISFSVLSIVGIFAGSFVAARFVDGKKLKVYFGWFVLVMGVYILFVELYSSQ